MTPPYALRPTFGEYADPPCSGGSNGLGSALLLVVGVGAAVGAAYVFTMRGETERRLTALERASAAQGAELREVLTELRAVTADLRAGHVEPPADIAPASTVRQLRAVGGRR